MDNKRELLKRTVSFITAVSIVAGYQGSSAAVFADTTGTSVPATSEPVSKNTTAAPVTTPPHVQTTTEEITTVTTTESEEDKIKSIASGIQNHIDNNIISANIEMDSDIKKNDVILLAAKTGWKFYDVSSKNENKNIDSITVKMDPDSLIVNSSEIIYNNKTYYLVLDKTYLSTMNLTLSETNGSPIKDVPVKSDDNINLSANEGYEIVDKDNQVENNFYEITPQDILFGSGNSFSYKGNTYTIRYIQFDIPGFKGIITNAGSDDCIHVKYDGEITLNLQENWDLLYKESSDKPYKAVDSEKKWKLKQFKSGQNSITINNVEYILAYKVPSMSDFIKNVDNLISVDNNKFIKYGSIMSVTPKQGYCILDDSGDLYSKENLEIKIDEKCSLQYYVNNQSDPFHITSSSGNYSIHKIMVYFDFDGGISMENDKPYSYYLTDILKDKNFSINVIYWADLRSIFINNIKFNLPNPEYKFNTRLSKVVFPENFFSSIKKDEKIKISLSEATFSIKIKAGIHEENQDVSFNDDKIIDVDILKKFDGDDQIYILSSYTNIFKEDPNKEVKESILPSDIIEVLQGGGNNIAIELEKETNSLTLNYIPIENIDSSIIFKKNYVSNVKNNNGKDVYSIKSETDANNILYTQLLEFTSDSDLNYIVTYDKIERSGDSGYKTVKYSQKVYIDTEDVLTTGQSFLFEEYIPDGDLCGIVITGMIPYTDKQTDNDKINNIYSETPVYFYNDNQKPVISLTEGLPEKNTDKWVNKDIEFNLNVNDFSTDNNVYDNFLDHVYSPVKEIKAGAYTFTKIGGIWTGTTTEDDVPYDVVINQTEADDNNSESFSVSVISKYETLNIPINVSVTDAAGNVSDSSQRNIKIDKKPPVMRKVELNGFAPPSSLFVRNGNKLVIRTNADDNDEDAEKSGYNSTMLFYLYDNGDNNKTYSSDNKDSEFTINDVRNTEGVIGIKIKDNADNYSVYYYDGAGFTQDRDQAVNVLFDCTAPEVTEITPSVSSKYTDGTNKWYDLYPDLTISATDFKDDGKISSGIKQLCIKVNGHEIIIPASSLDLKGQYVLKAEQYSEWIEDNGKITVTVNASDNSENDGPEKAITFFVDDNKPSSSDKFSVSPENVQKRTYGTFYNDTILLSVEVSDNQLHSSGLKTAYISSETGKAIECISLTKQGNQKHIATFKIDPSDDVFLTNGFNITVEDNTGNTFTSKVPLVSDQNSSKIMIEKNKPVISVDSISGNNKYEAPDNKTWYSSDVSITYKVTDGNSGISTVKIFRQNQSSGFENIVSEDFTNGTTPVAEYIEAVQTDTDKDGEFVFHANAEDNSTNHSDDNKEVTVYKDTTAPEVTGFKFGDSEGILHLFNGMYIPYFFFLDKDTEATVYVRDINASSGIKNIEVRLCENGKEDVISTQSPDITMEKGEKIYSFKFTVPEGFKGEIKAIATDNVNNTPDEYVSPKALIVENDQRHSKTSSISVQLPETAYKDISGLPLYPGDISASISVKDEYSGIRSIDIEASEYGSSDEKKSIYIDNDANITGSQADQWQNNAQDRNIICDLSRQDNMSLNRNGNNIKVDFTDNSNNTSSSQTFFSIDKTAPEISVSFDNNQPDSVYTNIYGAPRTATVQIKERNFDPDKVKISEPYHLGSWSHVSGTEGTDDAVYQSTVTFAQDGTYSFTIDCSDMCDNKAAQYTCPEFIVDLTAPVIVMSFDNNSNSNGNYYRNTRTAEITVKELNFDPSRIHITGLKDGSEEGFPGQGPSREWTHVSEDIWTTKIKFEDNGYYTISVTGTDKAGHSAAAVNNSFYIDTIDPDIKFKDVTDTGAYNGKISPVIEINDTNLNPDTVNVSITGAKNGSSVSLQATQEKQQGKYVYKINNITENKEFDDIYTISVSASDYAGRNSSETIRFSVNRFGSTFEPDEETAKLQNAYISKPQDLIIKEINVDPHDKNFNPIVTLTKDGNGITLVEGNDYSIEKSGEDTTWSEYSYCIFSENFSDDAVYELSIYSEDKSTNKNNSSSILTFCMDKTKPTVNFVNIKSGGVYKTDVKSVTALIEDNMEIDKVMIYLNGKAMDESQYSYNPETMECSFNISNSNQLQKIEVIPYDMAGNAADQEQSTIDDVFISTNTFKILMHKVWFKVLAAVAAIAILGAGAAVIIKKKKRN